MSATTETVPTTTVDEPKVEAPATEPTPEVKTEVRQSPYLPQRLTELYSHPSSF
jgi:hypothetical protein